MVFGSKQKLALIIAVIVVTVPSIGFGIYYGVNKAGGNIIDSTSVSISSVQILSADDSGMNLSIQGIIDNPSSLSANMDDLNLSVNYNSVEIGTTQIQAMSLSAGNNSIDQQVFMTITDQSEFSIFLNDFVKSATVTLSVNGTASISASKINLTKDISKNVTIDGFGGLQYQLLNVSLNSASSNSLSMTTQVEIENPTLLNAIVSSPLINLTYQQSWIGNFTLSTTDITTGENTIDAVITISGDQNVTAVDNFLSAYISGENVPLSLSGDMSLKLNGMQNYWNFSLNLGSNLQGINEDFISSVVVNSVVINLTPTPSMTANVIATIDNPFNFAVNITSLQYDVYFNDPYGYLGALPQDNIKIESVSSNSLQLTGSGSNSTTISISNNILDTCTRLSVDYGANNLIVDLKNGIMNIAIGEFTATVDFTLSGISVS